MAVLGYLRNTSTNGVYCPLLPGATARDVIGAIGEAIGATDLRSHEELVRALAEKAPLELGVDCEDVPDASGVAEILRLIDEVADDVSLLVASRSRAAFEVRRFVASGTGSLCDAERLGFTADEIRHLAETCGVPFTHADVLRMLEVTDGWPQVVSGALRMAAEDSRSVSEAFENWRTRRGHLFNEFIAATLAHVPEPQADLVLKLMSGSHLDDREQLQSLEEQGLFVVHTPDGYRPLRALSRTRLYDRYGRRVQPSLPLQVRLLGWFHAELDHRPIEWIRRRDKQIFKYVALQPNGSASRAEIGHLFWPDAEKHLAAQSLRTACSNIRKAIAHIVGFDRVDSYFRAGEELSVNLENVIVDVIRFVAHCDDGDENFERGELRAAYSHYRRAERIYRGDLLIGDVNEPWVAAPAAMLRNRHAMALERVGEIAAALDDETASIPDLRLASGS